MSKPTATMSVRKINDRVSVIDVQGEVTSAAENALMDAYSQAGSHVRAIVLNFSDLVYMNSSGIGLLVTLLIRINRQKQRLLAYGLSEHYRQIFALTRLDEAIGINRGAYASLGADLDALRIRFDIRHRPGRPLERPRAGEGMSTAGELRSGKGHRDENFPVASRLIDARHRGIILAFYEFVRVADDISDHARLSEAEKLAQLDRLEANLLGNGDYNPEAVRLTADRLRQYGEGRAPEGLPEPQPGLLELADSL